LKRRLEDLERRAASSSASPEQSPAEPDQPKMELPAKSQSRSSRSSKQQATASNWSSPQAGVASNEIYHPDQDERATMFSHQSTRQLSASPPPPLFYHPSYSYQDSYGHQAYPSPPAPPQHHQSGYHTLPPVQYGELSVPTQYLDSLPSPLHPLPASTNPATKRVNAYGDEDILSPFSMSYASMAGIDLSTTTTASQENHLQVNQSHPFPLTWFSRRCGSDNLFARG
jgi:hypothetical protein